MKIRLLSRRNWFPSRKTVVISGETFYRSKYPQIDNLVRRSTNQYPGLESPLENNHHFPKFLDSGSEKPKSLLPTSSLIRPFLQGRTEPRRRESKLDSCFPL